MKKIIILAFCSLAAQIALALTETVDGITWSYYVSDGYAILEHPDTQKKKACPKPVHEGVLPPILRIPSVLGGYEVGEIGMAAFQIPNDSDVQKIIVPETVKRMQCDSAFLGQYSSTDTESSGKYFFTVFRFALIECDVIFLGDCPYNTSASNPTWEFRSGGYTYRYACRAGARTYNGSIFTGQPILSSRICYIVDGTLDWTTDGQYCGGTVSYYAARVYFMPDDGIITPEKFVEMSCSNAVAKIYYTIDGSEPVPYASASSCLYSGPFLIDHKVVVKALAYVKAYPAQVTYVKEFALGKVIQPTVVASDGVLFNWSGNMIALATETENAGIRYTLDGSEPTETSMLYSVPFAIDDTTTVKAKAFKEDWFESETATVTFTREWYTVATPVIEPSDTTFANISQEVVILCETEGAKIFYTTDGSDPVMNGLEYTKPFTVYGSCMVRAVAVKYDWKNSAEATATFTRGESLSEAANLYGYTMETDEVAPWIVDGEVSRDGVSSVRSGAIGNTETTWLQTSIKKAGTVSFWWKVACEGADEEEGEDGYYDYGAFLVDDVVVARIAGHDGEWHYVSHEVTSGGKHTLKWEYRKDGATSYAPDCVWVDQVQWIPADGSGYTLTTPEPVPYSWLDAYRLGVGTDYETAGNAASGKMQGGRALQVWQDYVAGTDPTNLASRFTAKIEMVDGAPVVTWEPDLNTNGVIRAYKVYGKETLEGGGEWQYPTNSLHRFFKVTVEMP